MVIIDSKYGVFILSIGLFHIWIKMSGYASARGVCARVCNSFVAGDFSKNMRTDVHLGENNDHLRSE